MAGIQEVISIEVKAAEAKRAFESIANSLKDIEGVVDKVNKSLSGVDKGMIDASKKAKQYANSLKEVSQEAQKTAKSNFSLSSSLKDAGKSLQTFGKNLVSVGAMFDYTLGQPIRNFGQDALEQFLAVDKEWARMSKAVGLSVDELKNKFDNLSTTIASKYGMSQAEVIEGLTEFAKAGFDSEKQLNTLGELAAQTAVNFDTDLNTAVEIVRDSMLQWGWSLKEVESGMATINEIADATATGELELAEVFTKVGGTAKAAGLDFRELAAQAAALQGRGYEAGVAGTALKAIYVNLTSKTKKLKDALAAMGVQVSTAKLNSMTLEEKMHLLAKSYGKFRDKLGLTKQDMKAWSESVKEGRKYTGKHKAEINKLNDAMADLIGKHHVSKAVSLLDDMANSMDNNKNTASEYEKAIKSINKPLGQLNDTFENKVNVALESNAMKWEQLKAKVDIAKGKMGGILSEALEPLVEKLIELLDKFQNLDPKWQKIIVYAGMFAAVIGGLLAGLGMIISVFGYVISAIGGIVSIFEAVIGVIGPVIAAIASLNPVVLAIVAVVLILIGAIILFKDKIKEAIDWVVEHWDEIKAKIKEVGGAILDYLLNVGKQIFDMFIFPYKVGWEIIKFIFNAIVALIKWWVKGIIDSFIFLWNAIKAVVEGIVAVIKWWWDTNTAIFNWAVDKIKKLVKWLWDGIKSLFNKGKETVTRIMIKVGTWLINKWQWVKDNIINKVIALKDKLIEGFKKMVDGIKEKMNDAVNKISEAWNKIKDAFLGKVNKAKSWGRDLMNNLIKGIKEKIGAVKEQAKKVADEIKKYLHFSVPDEGPLADADTYMPDFMELLANTLDKSAPVLYDKVLLMAARLHSLINPAALFNLNGVGGEVSLTPTLGDMGAVESQAAMNFKTAAPVQQVTEIHKHYEVKPGVMIASVAEQREFVRHIQKLQEMEEIRTNNEI